MDYAALVLVSLLVYPGRTLDFREAKFTTIQPRHVRPSSNTTSLFSTLIFDMIDCAMYCYQERDCEYMFYSHQRETCEGYSSDQLRGESYIEDNDVTAFQIAGSECSGFDYFYFGNLSMCFRFINKQTTWNNARERCLEDGADLVILESDEVMNIFIDFLYSYGGPSGRIHIGAKYDAADAKWKWMNGNEVSHNQQMSFSGPNQPCVGVKPAMRSLIDMRCDAELKIVCAKNKMIDGL